MFNGSILGERKTDIAKVAGIIGIGIISSSKTPAHEMKLKERQKVRVGGLYHD